MQRIEFNKVTWYSKLASVIVLLAGFPIVTFYIGNVYSRTYNTVVVPTQNLGLGKSVWSDINMDQREVSDIFDIAQTTIQKENASNMLYNIFLVRKFGSWIHVRLIPIALDENTTTHEYQMYLQKRDGVWRVQASNASLEQFCTTHVGFCL